MLDVVLAKVSAALEQRRGWLGLARSFGIEVAIAGVIIAGILGVGALGTATVREAVRFEFERSIYTSAFAHLVVPVIILLLSRLVGSSVNPRIRRSRASTSIKLIYQGALRDSLLRRGKTPKKSHHKRRKRLKRKPVPRHRDE